MGEPQPDQIAERPQRDPTGPVVPVGELAVDDVVDHEVARRRQPGPMAPDRHRPRVAPDPLRRQQRRERLRDRLRVQLDRGHRVAARERRAMVVRRERDVVEAGLAIADRQQGTDRVLDPLRAHQEVDVADDARGGIAVQVLDQIGDALEQNRLGPDRVERGGDLDDLIGDPAVALPVEPVHRLEIVPHLGRHLGHPTLVA